MSFKDAKAILESDGLKVTRNDVESDKPKGQVLSANPTTGTTVASGTSVALDVSQGPKAVPNVVGMTQDEAEQAIRAAGFKPDPTDDASSTEPAGTVTKQSPPDGTTQAQGSPVVIWVSTYTPPPPPVSSEPACPTPTTLPDGTQTCLPPVTPPAGEVQ
jgi:serine/threonine-protein kinase